MIFLLLWMTLVPFLVETFQNDGSIILEETLPDLLRTNFMLSHGRIITIGDLYGLQVNRENFNPGIGFYEFYDNNRRLEQPQILECFPHLNHPMMYDVAFDYIESAYTASRTEKLILMTGDPQTGKTTALRRIEFMMDEQHSPALALHVDVPKIFKSDPPSSSITNEDILKGAVYEDYVDLVKNILEINPSNVKILLDGIDQVPPHTQEKILSTVSEFNRRGVHVIMTSNTDIRPALTARKMSSSTFHIPSTLSNNQFELVMTNYWMEKLSILNNLKQQQRLREYSKAIRILIEETPLPRSVSAARILAEDALKPNYWKPFPSVSEYLEPKNSLRPKKIIKLSNQMRLPKMHFYDQILKHYTPMMKAYGPQALNMIFESKSIQIKIELTVAMKLSNEFITNHGQHAFGLLKFSNGVPIDFIHEEYKRFFAAKYIIDRFASDTPLVASFKEILSNPEHIFVLEFIDSAINNLRADKMMRTVSLAINTPKFAESVFDNLIQYRLDNLCAQMFARSGKENLKNYLNKKTTIQSRNKYSFGILSEVRDVDSRYYLPRKTPWQYSGTRVEMMVNLDMKKTQLVAERSGFPIDSSLRLIYAAKQSPEYFDEFMKKYGLRPYSSDVLNSAMYEALDSLGKDSFTILVTLQALGAEPANVNKNGRTLAHVAAQYHDWEVLFMVHEDLRLPLVEVADGNGRTILIELLESGMPFNTYTSKGAWEAMLYLVENGDLSCNRDLIAREDLLEFSPKTEEITGPYKKLLIYSEELESERITVIEILEKYIPLREIEVPSSVSSTRRKLLMKNCKKIMMEEMASNTFANEHFRMNDFVSISELVISHHDALRTFDFNVYKNTVKALLLREIAMLNKVQINRLLKLMAKNTRSMSELVTMFDVVKTLAQSHLQSILIPDANAIFTQRIQKQFPIIAASSGDVIAQSLYDLNPNIVFDVPDGNGEGRRNTPADEMHYLDCHIW